MYWFDQNTTPGAHWDDAIKWKLNSADVMVFFVTPNFGELPDLNFNHNQGITLSLHRINKIAGGFQAFYFHKTSFTIWN